MKLEHALNQVINLILGDKGYVKLSYISALCGVCLYYAADYAAAKEGLARMKYFVNIEELLKDTLDLPL